jgi:hypothetical protein
VQYPIELFSVVPCFRAFPVCCSGFFWVFLRWFQLPLLLLLLLVCFVFRGRGSSVGIAIRYGLDGPGIESRLGQDFPHPSRPALGYNQPPIQWVPGLPGGKAARDCDDHSTQSSTKAEGRVQLYICSISGPSWSVIGRTLSLPLPLLVSPFIYVVIIAEGDSKR